MLAAFPLTTARKKCWWSHWHYLEASDIYQQVSLRGFSKKGWLVLPYTPVVSIAAG